ncbi:MAG: DHH family phosphoesterase [Methanomethylovorans sp.]|nr:DHH family phosphoesterase [Methanomethylovorans sp.]
MSEKCPQCNGKGYIVTSSRKCPECKGSGKSKSIDFMKLSEKDVASFLSSGSVCLKCGGTGDIEEKDPCKKCNGKGILYTCKTCGASIDQLLNEEEICEGCGKKQVVYKLDDSCTIDEIEIGKLYHCVVSSNVTFGTFVDINSKLRGLIHSSNIKETPKIGDSLVVSVKEIRNNNKLDLLPRNISSYQTVEVEKELPEVNSSKLSENVGKTVRVHGEVIQVKQTAGPTIFTVDDETGQISAAAFESAGERAYPNIDADMIVSITGEVQLRGDTIQLEVSSMKRLTGDKEKVIRSRIEDAIDIRAEPHDTKFLVKSDVLEKLRPAMKQVAKEIRKAVIKSKPILLRHHADADGMTAAVAIERAILPLIRQVNGPDGEYYFYKRAPSKAPFYELTDVTRDVSFALEDRVRHGQKMPLVVSVDNGSTLEDLPSFRIAHVYNIDMVVVDHHHPDKEVDEFLKAHVNPAHVGGDYSITAGMLCTEIARMINPDVESEILHLPAVAAVGDRADSEEARDYIKLVSDRYSLQDLKDMALALDYAAYWLKFSSGKGIVDDILDLGDHDTHRKLVRLFCEQANGLINEQLEACMAHVKVQKLPNGALLNVLDIENHAHKFTFPPPGKTSGEVHDRLCKKYEGLPVVTLGYGPDFAVIRSKSVRMNIPQMVRELHDEIEGGGVNGGGHLVVGSIKFVEGMRTQVLSKLAEKIGAAEVE